MSRFVYRMQNILNIKEKLEEQARMDFGMAMVRLMEEEEKLSCLQDRKTGYESDKRIVAGYTLYQENPGE